ncbi:hypothetical protein C7212DRAFT_343589 [Tuber magnatum]|uniref:Uncharacterized protein n=1 Tax=Tuber magnatum TaxID=42249 RepID=A0A317SPZ0_9PEZI|nr:hypothetical protein C7212DRAFT_343589 [Tuber magnatum]
MAVLASHPPPVREISRSAVVDADVRDVGRVSPLHLAAQEGGEETTALPLCAGADAGIVGIRTAVSALVKTGADVSAADMARHTPLRLAEEYSPEVVDSLLEKGREMNDEGGECQRLDDPVP